MSSTPTEYPTPPGWLASIPGYGGYHAKEQRRLADRAVREELARRLASSIQQLQRLSAALARSRRYPDLAPVDAVTGRLHLLADRLRTAPEGYRGLFENDAIDEGVLEQVIGFDAALASGIERVAVLSGSLNERAAGPVLESPAGVELVELVEKLHERLDARAGVFTSGVALTPAKALAVLQEPPRPQPRLSLKPGDALSYGNTDYVADAVVTYQGQGGRAWTEYRLRDGSAERWLLVGPEASSLLEPIAAEEVSFEQSDSAVAGGERFHPRADGQATASVVGPAGERRGVPVSYRDYAGEAEAVLAVRDFDGERRIFRGTTIDPALLTVYPRT